eukprot:gnl/MRDRNA2_/MRDRNA2_84897_c0_seq2.p1 gnl/MRDRNA2_/MRDRNA2_84897_c0~~gnl/MRDRNA2_/MRDRNA2_84897_c0_seq2.p1  ORF type:complete len:243 (+),score=44.66 gnl/MRDRNA2_/MRDRNA2_84897_c0_seq2:111-839(+)
MFAPDVTNRLGKQEFGSNKTHASVSTRASSKECSLDLRLTEENLQIHNLRMDARQSHECCANQRTNAIEDLNAIPWLRDMLDNFDPDAESECESTKQHEVTKTIMDFDATPGITDMMENVHLDAESDSDSEVDGTLHLTRYMKERCESICTNPWGSAKAEWLDQSMGGAGFDVTDSMLDRMPRVPAMVFSSELLAEIQRSVANGEWGATESDSDTESCVYQDAESHFADDEVDLPDGYCFLK